MLDSELRKRARKEKKSLNAFLIETLASALGVQAERRRRRSLGDLAGTWVDDPDTNDALADQDRVDPNLWR